MAAPPNTPNIQKSANAYNLANLKPARIIENASAKTVAQALTNGKSQVEATK
jgi:hypothetical protein